MNRKKLRKSIYQLLLVICMLKRKNMKEDTKKLEFNQRQKSHKAMSVTFADFECLIEITNGSKNNPESSLKAKVGKHIPSDLSMSTKLLFKRISINVLN